MRSTKACRGRRNLHDGVVERGGDGIGPHVSPRLALQRVAPPLQPDLAGHALAHGIAHARDLEIEGIEREEETAASRQARKASPRYRSGSPSRTSGFAMRQTAKAADRRHALGHGDQRRADLAVLGEQDVVGARRGSGLHARRGRFRASRKPRRRSSGTGATSRPVPRSRRSSASPSAKHRRERFEASARPQTSTGQAWMPDGSARIEPRCDISAKRNPPSP